jgi:hypothetical protein
MYVIQYVYKTPNVENLKLLLHAKKCRIYIPCHLRLNVELELKSLFGLHVHSCTHWPRPRNPPPPHPHLGSYTRALLVSQDRRHLFVTPCLPLQ